LSDEKIKYLDNEGIKIFSEAFFNKVNDMLDGRIVNTIDENSTDDQIPSAEAIEKLINEEGDK